MNDSRSTDWFVPAIVAEGNVRDSLQTLIGDLDRKSSFVRQLMARLCDPDSQVDRLTSLSRSIKELENTLRFRLGILPADRSASWFRDAQTRDFGPFRSAMIMAPVFCQYPRERSQQVKAMLYDAWNGKTIRRELFDDSNKNCLWFILIEHRHAFDKLCTFEGIYSDLQLEHLPDGLPKDLESKALHAYLARVRLECIGIREKLKVCFDQLWTASERFWKNYQRIEPPPRRPPAMPKRFASGEEDALAFMGFLHRPSVDILRKRYRELAKSMHPDVNGGHDEAFKTLNKSYHRLLTLYKIPAASNRTRSSDENS